MSRIAAEFDVELSAERCDALWDDRSAFVHGAAIDFAEPHDQTDLERGYEALVETLRRTVRHAIENAEFARLFRDDSRIRERWPVQPPRRR